MRILRLLTIAVVIQIWTGAIIYAHGQVMAEDMLIRTPTVIAAITDLHSRIHQGGVDKTEWSFVVRADGTPSKPQSSHDYAANHLTVALGSDRAIVHSHPDGTAPFPSDADSAAAKKCRIPNYVVSGYHIYVAEPDGKTVRKVADIEQGKHNTINIKWGAK
jgi:proteasome lid subunit RPN8/RPN11